MRSTEQIDVILELNNIKIKKNIEEKQKWQNEHKSKNRTEEWKLKSISGVPWSNEFSPQSLKSLWAVSISKPEHAQYIIA